MTQNFYRIFENFFVNLKDLNCTILKKNDY